MAANSPIEWTDHTWSPWEGCTKVSPGCDHCYAEGMNRWLRKGANWGPGAPRRTYSEEHWLKPVRWNEKAAKEGRRVRVFPSVCDPFDNEVGEALRGDFLWLVEHTRNLDWLVLTKRIGNAARMLQDLGYVEPLPNLWLGATIVNQEEADRDIPKLLATPARVRFLSMEPLLSAVDLHAHLRPWPGYCQTCGAGLTPPDATSCNSCGCSDHDEGYGRRQRFERPDWVIVGGESGHGARPMHPDWARSLRDQCAAAGVPLLFKQWGEFAPDGTGDRRMLVLADGTSRPMESPEGIGFHAPRDGAAFMYRVGKKAAGRLLDGRTHDQFPEVRP